jgi:dethiobiotin synthetase
MRRIVILGTGTGVGKTHVSVALGRALSARSAATGSPRRSALLKPIESGFSPDAPSDASRLWAESRAISPPSTHPRYALAEPISPHLAARRAGTQIDIASVQSWLADWEREQNADVRDLAVIETAGGVFSPLSDTSTNFDLARALEPARWVLVAPDALGVLHELTATLTALAARGRSPDFVVLSAAREPDASTGSNAAELRRLGIADPAAVLGRDASDLAAFVELLLA